MANMYPTDDPFLSCVSFNEETPLEFIEHQDQVNFKSSPSSGSLSFAYDDVSAEHIDMAQLMQRVQCLETVIRHILPIIPTLAHHPIEIKKSDLDRLCLALFEQAPEPTPVQLNNLVSRLEERFPGHDRRVILSAVRKWFRKKREEVGLRLTTTLKKLKPDLKESRTLILELVSNDQFDMVGLVHEARLSLNVSDLIIRFCRKKLISHLQRP